VSDDLIDLPIRTVEDTGGDVQRLLGRLEQSGNALKVVRMMANSENAFKPFVLMSTALMAKSPLPATDREVIILHLAARRGVQYEWEEHASMSAMVGITDEQRDLLSTGSIPGGDAFEPSQTLALRMVDQILDKRGLSPELWSEGCQQWGQAGALDVIFVVAWWGGFVPTIIEAFGLRTPY
jgi:4-carboxymuconolactone decarboxylase